MTKPDPNPPEPTGAAEMPVSIPMRALSGVMFLGALALAYICLDLALDGGITRTLRRG